VKHIKHDGNITLEEIIDIARFFRFRSNNEFAQLLPFINFQTGRMQGAKSPYAVVIPGSALGAQFSLENSPFLHHSVR